MSKIKVGIVTKSIDTSHSAPSICLENLCQEFLKLEDEKVKFYFIHHKKIEHPIYEQGNEIICSKLPGAFMGCIAKKDLDIIHYNCPTFKRPFFYFLPFKKVVTLHGNAVFEMSQEYLRKQNRWLEQKGNTFLAYSGLLNKVDKFIAVSQGLKEEAKENYRLNKEKITVIPNGVNINKFKPRNNKENEIRKEYNIKENQTVGLFAAHEFERKGLRPIVKALPAVKNEIKLLIAGKDNFAPYKELSTNLGVGEQLIYVGNIKKGMEKYYAASDFFIFPTQYEAFSLVMLETMASGLPLLITKVNGAKELVKNSENGFFIKRESSSIADRLNTLLENPDLMEKLQTNARKTAEKYTWRKMAQRTLKLYKSLAHQD